MILVLIGLVLAVILWLVFPAIRGQTRKTGDFETQKDTEKEEDLIAKQRKWFKYLVVLGHVGLAGLLGYSLWFGLQPFFSEIVSMLLEKKWPSSHHAWDLFVVAIVGFFVIICVTIWSVFRTFKMFDEGMPSVQKDDKGAP